MEYKFIYTLSQWASDPDNAAAWKEIMAADPSVTYDPFADIYHNFTFGDAALMHVGELSMNKARRMGWTGFVDTRESIYEMYDELSALGLLPPMKANNPRPLA